MSDDIRIEIQCPHCGSEFEDMSEVADGELFINFRCQNESCGEYYYIDNLGNLVKGFRY